MSRRSGLGKGLSSLIPQAEQVGGLGEGERPMLTEIAVGDISPNPNQPRVHFDEETLTELAASIAQIGVLQPILVRSVPSKRAGLTAVPAIIRVTDDISAVEEALVENLHRQDLTALEEAAAFLQLIEDFQLTHDDVARRIGKSRSAVTNTLRLLGLPPEVQRLLADGKLSAGHARAILGTPDRALQERLAKQAAAEGWSVRYTEDVVRSGGVEPAPEPVAPAPAPKPKPTDGAGLTGATRLRPPGLLELEQLLADHLDTRVGVQMGTKRGKVTVEFADLEDLERIYRLIVE